MTLTPLTLTTTLTRPDQHGDDTQYRVALYARIESYVRGYLADHTDPAQPDEYEFAMLGAEWDDEDADMLGPITAVELGTLLAWLMSDAGDAAAREAAEAARGVEFGRRIAA